MLESSPQKPLKRIQWQSLLLWLPALLFLGFFFYQPLLAIFSLVFSPRWGFDPAKINPALILRPLGFTFLQASISTLLTLCFGLPLAWLFARFQFFGKGALRLLTTLPFILPTVVTAAAFNALLGANGWVNLGLMALLKTTTPPISFLNTFAAIITAHVFYNSAIIIRIVGNAWQSQNPRLVQAAQSLGASPWRSFLKITLPLLKPALLSALLLVFLFNFTSFGVILMLGGSKFATIEVEIYTQAMHMLNLPMAGVLSLIQLGFTLLVMVLHARITNSAQPATTTQAQTAVLKKPGGWFEISAVVLLALLVFVLLAAPLLALGLRSFTMIEKGSLHFTLRNYAELFINRRQSLFYVPPIQAAINSLGYALITVLIALSLGVSACYALLRHAHLSRWLEPLLMLPLGASAVTLGLGFLVVFNHPPFDLRSFPLLLPIAHSLVALPFVIRSLLPALRNIPDSLRQAARSLGASPLRTWLAVDLPILARALTVSAVFAFTISLGEFGASSFLARPESPTLPVAIFRYIAQPGALNYGQALAMSTLLMGVCALGIVIIEKIRLPQGDIL